ncbi:hypothetical protein C3L33_08594, partial [Rhododendron williamsianum]
MASHPKNVGILAIEIYFPPTCIQQETLEAHDGVSKGKYTIGLGQDCMAFCTEVEDVISMSLTAVSSLLEKYGIDAKQIGRLEVGSETVIDKSKSIKTFLMPIFEVYAEGPARPTGGAAAIAMLIGPDAPIAFESKLRGSHMSHAYDFYKPNLASEYPVVDGKLSQTCHLMALDSCYKSFCKKYEKLEGKQFSADDADYFVFHSPYNKLVQKSFARLVFSDYLRNASSVDEAAKEKLAPYSSLTDDESYSSRDLEKASQQVAKPLYDAKVGQRVVMFSYGSGLTATLFSFKIREGQHPFSLSNIATVMNVGGKLKSRHEFPPEKFVETMKVMEHRYGGKDFVTTKDCSLLSPGTYYLTEVDSKYRRFYTRKAVSDNVSVANGH